MPLDKYAESLGEVSEWTNELWIETAEQVKLAE